ncbi:hypothetical protein HPP92_014531 [Vanilla planifolia]|uniref:protein-serine/threonine phosphatase n=1 Tax=Vanilla planifolia TaxID=51239 RepID=A0A835QK68_VANPL|nr:hypothetical protein HPP92_014531 [Vanilla planifolia]
MGSGASRHLRSCFRPVAGGGCVGFDEENVVFEPGSLDETLGHSFRYVRSSSPVHSRSSSASFAAEIAFKSISCASVSANSSSTFPIYDNSAADRPQSAGFQSSSSFSAIPLHLAGSRDGGFFLSGPIERGALSGPIEPTDTSLPFSGPLVKKKRRRTRSTLSGRFPSASFLRRSLSEKNRPWVVPLRSVPGRRCETVANDAAMAGCGSVQWAHGKAGEDRVHVVVSEEQRWLFVGIYDGFNGPEAPEFLVGNLYRSVFNELRGLFWEEAQDSVEQSCEKEVAFKALLKEDSGSTSTRRLGELLAERDDDGGFEFAGSGRFAFSLSKLRTGFGGWRRDGGRIWFPRWALDSEGKTEEIKELPERRSYRTRKAGPIVDHDMVLRALSRALEATELAFLKMTDREIDRNPELALMGSCLLVAVMRDDDVYVMNIGDSRAIVGHYRLQGSTELRRTCAPGLDLEGIINQMEIEDPLSQEDVEMAALQLSTDHSTSIPEEVLRIKEEHPDDSHCIVNDRVKGRLKVTRAFGAGYLKQAKWNNGLLEMFKNEFIGSTPYISCMPSLCHHKLRPSDQFLVLSSDGLYQYLSNEEVVLYVESFMEKFPDGDPAQSLIEELLFRAAKKAGMEVHELLDIPQGDRRKYHDDVTVMVISLEGRIWKSSGKYL